MGFSVYCLERVEIYGEDWPAVVCAADSGLGCVGRIAHRLSVQKHPHNAVSLIFIPRARSCLSKPSEDVGGLSECSVATLSRIHSIFSHFSHFFHFLLLATLFLLHFW